MVQHNLSGWNALPTHGADDPNGDSRAGGSSNDPNAYFIPLPGWPSDGERNVSQSGGGMSLSLGNNIIFFF